MKPAPDSLQAELGERLRFERLLTDLSARFVGLPGEELDHEIESAQQRICEHLDLDRSTLSLFDGPEKSARFTHSWAVGGFSRLPAINAGKLFPWSSQRLLQGQMVKFSSLDEVPPAAAIDLVEWRKIGQKSNVTFPLIAGGQVLGALSFGALRTERPWPDELVSRLRLIADIFANALARRYAENETRRYLQELAHVSRVATMGELAGSLAHEINQPLTAILSNIQAAQRYLNSEPTNLAEVREILTDVVTENRRASDIIARIRGMIKKVDTPVAPCDLNGNIREVLHLLQGDLTARKVTAALMLTPNLPAVNGDRVQLEQVLINLILNGCDAMAGLPPAERQLRVETGRTAEGLVRVAVSDSGVGIAPENLERVFDAFYTTKSSGLGLGLPICRSIIQAHGGRLGATSTPGRGASFHFTLPASGE